MMPTRMMPREREERRSPHAAKMLVRRPMQQAETARPTRSLVRAVRGLRLREAAWVARLGPGVLELTRDERAALVWPSLAEAQRAWLAAWAAMSEPPPTVEFVALDAGIPAVIQEAHVDARF
jgi:hypothetical protein